MSFRQLSRVGRLMLLLVLLVGLAPGVQATESAESAENEGDIAPVPFLPTYRNVPYTEADQARQTLDIYLPLERDETMPVIVMVHGGGFVFGDKFTMNAPARHFAARGYAVIAPTYRLAPDHTYPAAVEDAFCAFAWVYQHAEALNLDVNRLILMGESAGANLVALLGTVDDPAPYLGDCPHALPDDATPQAVVAYYMPADLSSCDCIAAKQMAAVYLGVDPAALDLEEQIRQRFAEASPLAWVGPDEPPFLLIHGDQDNLVAPSESEAYAQRLREMGNQVEMVSIEGAGHGFFSDVRAPHSQRALQAVADFLAELTPERTLDAQR